MRTSILFSVLALSFGIVQAYPQAVTQQCPEGQDFVQQANQGRGQCEPSCPEGRIRPAADAAGDGACIPNCKPGQELINGNDCADPCTGKSASGRDLVRQAGSTRCIEQCDFNTETRLFGDKCVTNCPRSEQGRRQEFILDGTENCRPVCESNEELLFGNRCYEKCTAGQRRENFVDTRPDGTRFDSARCIKDCGPGQNLYFGSLCRPDCTPEETRINVQIKNSNGGYSDDTECACIAENVEINPANNRCERRCAAGEKRAKGDGACVKDCEAQGKVLIYGTTCADPCDSGRYARDGTCQ